MFISSQLLICYVQIFVIHWIAEVVSDDTGPGHLNEDCPLEPQSSYSWLAKIWDRQAGTIVGHGSIVTLKAVLSSCMTFDDVAQSLTRLGEYDLIATNDKEVNSVSERCTQTRIPRRIYLYPKCTQAANHRSNDKTSGQSKFYDFAVWIVEEDFIFGEGFAPLTIPKDSSLLVERINEIEPNSYCELPTFTDSKDRNASVDTKTVEVGFIPFQTDCVELACAKKSNEDKRKNCEEMYKSVEPSALLCAYPVWTTKLPHVKEEGINWYAGSPLICNGTTIGIASRVIFSQSEGRRSLSVKNRDIHLIVTLAEPLRWLDEKLWSEKGTTTDKEDPDIGNTTDKEDPDIGNTTDKEDPDIGEILEKTKSSQEKEKPESSACHDMSSPIMTIMVIACYISPIVLQLKHFQIKTAIQPV